MAARQSTAKRFWSKVDVRGPDECWPWLAYRTPKDYGQFWLNGRNVGAHQQAWLLTYQGPVVPDAVYRHSCDNPPCCNYGHVTPGTQADNMADCVTKGRIATGDRQGLRVHPDRAPRGERSGKTSFTEAIVRRIRASLAAGVSRERVALEHGVTRSAIAHIKKRRSWGWLV